MAKRYPKRYHTLITNQAALVNQKKELESQEEALLEQLAEVRRRKVNTSRELDATTYEIRAIQKDYF